ncbi:small-conductance mechanosensitive channel [Saonia flava]|uniref:Small-conductance mechanosensitive channel n=1 Tax=Saonia flava TaxID=523696 RepID=A0A846R038_9FLAO|nr:mechanosensitive ion channel domain-containing protein [Saonia flava]NJB70734.1 small-conductance mechanosensitive channel [Saonia flava]
METVNEWKNLTFETLSSILKDIASALPGILGAIIILIFGWIVNKIVKFVLKKIFKLIKIDRVSEKINEAKLFGDSNIKIEISKILLGFVKLLLWLVFIIVAADIMHLQVISNEIANLLRYLPVLLTAVIIFMGGMYVAKLIKKALVSVFESVGFGGSKIVGNVVFYIIGIFVTITALNQAGIDTTIITSNFTIILGAFLFAIALGFGLGSRDIISDLLRTFYTRKNYAIGDKIELNDLKGTIEAIDNACLTLKTKDGKIVVPIKEISENRVKIKE